MSRRAAARRRARRARPPRQPRGRYSRRVPDRRGRDPLFFDLPGRLRVFGWHAYGFELPRDAVPLAGSLSYTYQAFRLGAAYGLQFHPEMRGDDLERWRSAPAYRRLLAASGREWRDVAAELERAAPELDELAAKLLDRWLGLIAAIAQPTIAAGSSG